MKSLYYPVISFRITLMNNEVYEIERDYCMKYLEINDRIEYTYSYLKDNIYDFLDEYSFYICTDYTMKLKKYMRFCGEGRKIILKDIKCITVSITHRMVDNSTSITRIAKELGHEQFLQFIFDKEQSLKSVTESIGNSSIR